MEGDFSVAITLLAIGMITVFVVLLLVVIVGNLLIITVNRFFPTVVILQKSEIPKSKIAAITAAVDILTEGKGQIQRIDKIE